MTVNLDVPLSEARFSAFDLETTGTRFDHDRIIEIGIAVFEGGVVVDRYQQLVDPGVAISSEITEITGIKQEDVKGMPTLEEVADELVSRVDGQIMLAYNHTFDLGMLEAELRRIGRTVRVPACLDPFPFCWEHLKQKKVIRDAKLTTVSAYMEIALEAAHRADHDAEAAGHVMLQLPKYVALPTNLDALLQVQRALMQQVNEYFARFRSRRGTTNEAPSSVLQSGELVIELGAAYIFGEETDPVRALFARVPDVRDIRS